jgi:hypothetical protein
MVRVSNIDLHEMNECMAVKQTKPATSTGSINSMPDCAGSSVSSGSSGSEDDRRRRFAARLDACKAQAQAVGKIENCLAVDFTEDVYAAYHVAAPRGSSFKTDNDYVAVARAAGRIEDCLGEVANSFFKKKQHHAYNKHAAAADRPASPAVTSIDDNSMPSGSPWICPECSEDNGADTHECSGCHFSNIDQPALEQLAIVRNLFSDFKLSPALTVMCSVAIGCAVGGATSVYRNRSLAECVVQGAMVGYFAGGFVAGVL